MACASCQKTREASRNVILSIYNGHYKSAAGHAKTAAIGVGEKLAQTSARVRKMTKRKK